LHGRNKKKKERKRRKKNIKKDLRGGSKGVEGGKKLGSEQRSPVCGGVGGLYMEMGGLMDLDVLLRKKKNKQKKKTPIEKRVT